MKPLAFLNSKSRLILLTAMLSSMHVVSAQSNGSEKLGYSLYGGFNTVYFANAASFDYESHWHTGKNGLFRLNARLGTLLGWVSEEESDDTVTGRYGFGAGLVGFSMIWGKKNHHFVPSFGVVVGHSFGLIAEGFSFPLLELGWRFQQPEGGILWKVGVGSNGLSVGIGQAF